MNIVRVQNLQILGTIGDDKKAFLDICNALEDIACFAKESYNKYSLNKDIYTFYRLRQPGISNKFLVIANRESGKHNPYFAICTIDDKNHNVYKTDIKTLYPLLDSEILLDIKQSIIDSFSHELTLQASINEMEQYINEYDDSFDIADWII